MARISRVLAAVFSALRVSRIAAWASTFAISWMPCPPMPFVDAKWHGKLVIFGLLFAMFAVRRYMLMSKYS